MRKHSVFKLFIIAGLAWLVMTSNASAFMLPPGPISPTLDIVGDAAQGTKGVGDAVVSPLANKLKSFNENVVSKIKRLETSITEKINNAKEKVSGAFNQARDAVNNFGQKIKQGAQNVLSKFKGLLHKKEKGQSAVASARKIEEPKLVDVSSEEAIIASFETLFGKYPQDVLKKFPKDQEGVKKKYKDKAVEFSNDAMIELYIAVRDIEGRMDAIGEDIKGKTFALSGFGNVAWGAAKKISELGGKVLTISGPDGYVYDPDGISTDEKIEYIKNVSVEDIITVSKKISVNTIFLLEATNEENND